MALTIGLGPLGSLSFGSGNFNTTRFPSDLGNSPYFILFRASSSFGFPGISLGPISFNFSLPSAGFALPIPYNLTTNYNAQYESKALGAIGAIAARVGQNYAGGAGSITQAIKNANLSKADAQGALANMAIGGVEAGGAAAAGLLGSGPTGALTGAAAGQAVNGFLYGAGIARNPHLASVFTGVNFREHNFQYKLVAKNPKESDTIKNMIRNFKFHMAPRYKLRDHIFEYPSTFSISLRAGKYLFNFGESQMTNFSVNYAGEGAPAFFEDTGAPVSVVLNMTFREKTIITKREISQGR